MRPKISLVISASFVAAVIAFAVLLAGSGRGPAAAADAETAQLIAYFNQYRAQNGAAPLSTSASLNAAAQAAADDSVQVCGFHTPSGPGFKWGAQAYPTAETLWDVYENGADSTVRDWVADPKYGSVGVGRAYSSGCNLGHVWWMILDKNGGGATTAPTATPSNTPLPTNTGVPTATVAPTPSPSPRIRGDVNCDGVVNLVDGLEMLRVISGATANAVCLTIDGPDCLAGIATTDALMVLRYVGGLSNDLPDGCPPIGTAIAPPG